MTRCLTTTVIRPSARTRVRRFGPTRRHAVIDADGDAHRLLGGTLVAFSSCRKRGRTVPRELSEIAGHAVALQFGIDRDLALSPFQTPLSCQNFMGAFRRERAYDPSGDHTSIEKGVSG
jgi:hypothetical protein